MLRGLISCARCGKRLEGDWRHNRAFYRCRLADPAEYAPNSALDAEHPTNAYVREDRITTRIDEWLARLFDSDHINEILTDLANTTEIDHAVDLRTELAQRRITEADAKLRRYKATLDAGANPTVVAKWISEAEAERTAALVELANTEQREVVSEGGQQIVSQDSRPVHAIVNMGTILLGWVPDYPVHPAGDQGLHH